jgi:hypothetical protein
MHIAWWPGGRGVTAVKVRTRPANSTIGVDQHDAQPASRDPDGTRSTLNVPAVICGRQRLPGRARARPQTCNEELTDVTDVIGANDAGRGRGARPIQPSPDTDLTATTPAPRPAPGGGERRSHRCRVGGSVPSRT